MRKSILIAGSALAAIVVVAVAIPPLVDWTGTKDRVAARIAAATGRPVRIDGRMTLRLLPSPALTADGVVIGNPPGMAGDLARVDHLRLKPAVLPLLTGTVRLRTLELDRPVLALARDDRGRPNWHFDDRGTNAAETAETPSPTTTPPHHAARPDAEAKSEPDQPLPVERLTIRDGSLRYGDALTLAAVDADVALGGRSGPFQGKGSARLGGTGTDVAVEASLDRLEPGRGSPLAVTLRLPGDDAVMEIGGLVSRLSAGQTLRGTVKVRAADPARTLARLGLAASLPPGPLALGGDLTASAQEMALSALELSLGQLRATGTLSAGLAGRPQVDAQLSIASLDLDHWPAAPAAAPSAVPPPAPHADAEAKAPAPAPAPAADAPAPVQAEPGRFGLPRDLFVTAALDVASVVWHGQAARDARIEAVLDNGEIMLRQASATLPGTAQVAADGTLSADGGRPVFDGTIRLKAEQAGTLLAWAGAPVGGGVKRLDLTAPLRLAWPELTLADTRISVDNVPVRARGSIRLDRQPAVDATATLGGVELAVKGRMTTGKHLENVTFRLNARDGLGPLRALGWKPPGMLDRLAPLVAEGSASGTPDQIAVDNLSLRAGPTRLTGQIKADLRGTRPDLVADLSADILALDGLAAPERSGRLLPGGGPLLPPTVAPMPPQAMPTGMVGAGPAPFSREAMDLAALNAVDARLTLRAQTVTAKRWRLDNALLRATLRDGTATVEHLTGRLLGGDLTATGRLAAAATPTLTANIAVTGADLAAARLAGAGMTLTQGRADIQTRLSAQGRSPHDMAAHLDGDGTLAVRDGVLDGFDLPAVNRQMGDLRNIGSILGVVQAGLSGGRTPFSRLNGTFHAENGVVTSHDLKLEAEGGGAGADTMVNLPQWSTRTAISFHLAAAPQTPMVIRLEGPLENPRKVIDLNAIQQMMVARGLGRALKLDEAPANGDQPREKNTGRNILKNLLKGLGGQ